MPESEEVNRFFSSIATRYDLANRLMSGGMDLYWRRRLAALVAATGASEILDLATGSGDVAFALARHVRSARRVVGMDFCEPMLEQAREKLRVRPARIPVDFIQGDCLKLPLPDASMDAITIAFGLRNLENRDLGLREMARVLRPGGSLFVLEFSQPLKLVRPLYFCYLKYVIPPFSGWLTGDRSAYRYLADSVEAFPGRDALAREIAMNGFARVRSTGLTGSIVAIHEAAVD